MADNYRLMSTIADIKHELNQVRAEKDSMCNSIRMLNSGTDALEEILTKGKIPSDNSGLGFSKSDNLYEKQT